MIYSESGISNILNDYMQRGKWQITKKSYHIWEELIGYLCCQKKVTMVCTAWDKLIEECSTVPVRKDDWLSLSEEEGENRKLNEVEPTKENGNAPDDPMDEEDEKEAEVEDLDELLDRLEDKVDENEVQKKKKTQGDSVSLKPKPTPTTSTLEEAEIVPETYNNSLKQALEASEDQSDTQSLSLADIWPQKA